MRVTTFAEIEEAFLQRVHAAVWCSFATVDAHGRPRSRLLHTIWESTWEGPTGWIATRRHSPKGRDLEHNSNVSLAYVADVVYPVYVEAAAHWDDTLATRQHVWDLFLHAPPPLGYDPAPIYGQVDAPDYGVLQIRPHRIELGNVSGTGERRLVWRRPG
jgi:general stress protein 26